MSSLLRFDPRRHLLVKLGVFQNLATHYDRSESGLRRKTVPLHRSEMSNQMSVDIKKERNHLLSLPLHDGLQTVHRTVLRLSKNRDSLTNSWLISVVFSRDYIPRFRLRSATAFYQKSLMDFSMRDHNISILNSFYFIASINSLNFRIISTQLSVPSLPASRERL